MSGRVARRSRWRLCRSVRLGWFCEGECGAWTDSRSDLSRLCERGQRFGFGTLRSGWHGTSQFGPAAKSTRSHQPAGLSSCVGRMPRICATMIGESRFPKDISGSSRLGRVAMPVGQPRTCQIAVQRGFGAKIRRGLASPLPVFRPKISGDEKLRGNCDSPVISRAPANPARHLRQIPRPVARCRARYEQQQRPTARTFANNASFA